MIVAGTTVVREIAVDRAVVMWNYLDFAHLTVVHANYRRAELVYEDDNVVLEHLVHRVPFLPFLRSRSLHFFVKRPPGELFAFTQGLFGIPVVTRIKVESLGEDLSRITVQYRFALDGWRRWLRPWIPAIARRWNERTWQEDLPLKLRRQRALRAGLGGALRTDFRVLPSVLYPEESLRLMRLLLGDEPERVG